ncbi:Uncharacterised protein [uncultured archaeon]|nr:Uncharacterised protein [uncultured archaeon]
MGRRAQSSLEYLLLLAAFFAVFAAFIPIVANISSGFLGASDDFLAKRIAQDLNEQISLFASLGEGTKKSLEYSPASKIIIQSRGNELVVGSDRKQFSAVFSLSQVIPKQEFKSKIILNLIKDAKGVQIFVSGS